MNKFLKSLVNLPLGLFLGATIALVLAWALDNDVAQNFIRMKVFIFSSLLYLFASAVALAGVLKNLDFQREQVEDTRRRKAQSARAVLPNALSLFMDLARRGLNYNYSFSASGRITGLATDSEISTLALPPEAVEIFRELIENSNDERLRDHLFEILREHQVLVARSKGRGLGGSTSGSSEDYCHVVHWAYLSALTGIIFDYARGETKTLERKLTETTIQGQLHFAKLLFGPEQQECYQGAVDLYFRTYQRRLAN